MGSRIDSSSKPSRSHLPREVKPVEKQVAPPTPETQNTTPEPNKIQAQLQQDGFDAGNERPQDQTAPAQARGPGGAARAGGTRGPGGTARTGGMQGPGGTARAGGAQISTGGAARFHQDGFDTGRTNPRNYRQLGNDLPLNQAQAQGTEGTASTGGAQISTGNAATLVGAQGTEEAATADAGQVQGTEEAATADAAQVAPSPEVTEAIEGINEFDAGSQGYGLALALGNHRSNSPEDVNFRQGLMTALGADRVAEMVGNGSSGSEAPGIAHGVLTAAAEAYSTEDLGRVAQAVGPEALGAALSETVRAASDPNASEQTRASAQQLAQTLGSLYELPEGAPGRAAATEALARIQGGEQFTEAPGVSTAAWLVANSGNDQLRTDFANQYLNEFKSDQASLAPEEARAVAWALGSVEGPGTGNLDPIYNLDAAQRSRFLDQLAKSGDYQDVPDLDAGYRFQQDAVAGVNEFLSDVAEINPADFPDSRSAQNLRLETFQEVSKAVGGEFFADNEGTHAALAEMFASDTSHIVNESANTGSPLHDREGRALLSFFDHVAFRGENAETRATVTDALRNYLGVGDAQGIVDQLAAGKGEDGFMQGEGNILARNMGFVLGALDQGAQSAIDNIGDEYAQKRAVVSVLGSLVETAITHSPANDAYQLVKKSSGDNADVDAAFNWLADQFIGTGDEEKRGVNDLSGAVIEGAWDPFFSDENLQGADTGNLTDMFQLINGGVALADGYTNQPGINIGGAFTE
ncbi:MAG TPA: hypothetical protein VEU33_05300 [Archangium sp.]|nr:hypothetical protein [Archangium sp.]